MKQCSSFFACCTVGLHLLKTLFELLIAVFCSTDFVAAMDALVLPPDDEGFDRRALFGATEYFLDDEPLPTLPLAEPLPESVEDDCGSMTLSRPF